MSNSPRAPRKKYIVDRLAVFFARVSSTSYAYVDRHLGNREPQARLSTAVSWAAPTIKNVLATDGNAASQRQSLEALRCDQRGKWKRLNAGHHWHVR